MSYVHVEHLHYHILFVDNQIDNAIQFDEEGIIKYVGDIRTTDIVKNMKKYIHKIMDDAQKKI